MEAGFDKRVLAAFFDQQEKIAMTFGFFDELRKVAARELTGKEKVLKGIDTARPYAHRAMIGALPGAVLGTAAAHMRRTKPLHGRLGALPVLGAALGAGGGLADKYLENRSDDSRRMRRLLSSYQEKSSSLSGDLRRTHVGGARPPTEDSKVEASRLLSSSQSIGRFGNAASNRSIAEVGPKVKDLVL